MIDFCMSSKNLYHLIRCVRIKINAITGPIQETTYRRLIDKDGVYLNDINNNQLLAIKEYGVKNEDSE